MAKRSIKGIAFLLVGCLLLLVAGGWCLLNLAEDRSAGNQAAALLRQLEDQLPDPEQSSTLTLDGETFCGRVSIPRLKVELPVYDQWSYQKLKSAPCRYAGAVETANLILAAHNYKSHFGRLDKLRNEDEIVFTSPDGTAHRFTVSEIVTLDGTAVDELQSGGWALTLFTCTKSGQQRVTVRCNKAE